MAAKATYTVHGNAMTIESQLNAAGTGIEDVHVVPFTITSGPARGTRHHVKVPPADFHKEGVRVAIDGAVDNLHDVAALSTTVGKGG